MRLTSHPGEPDACHAGEGRAAISSSQGEDPGDQVIRSLIDSCGVVGREADEISSEFAPAPVHELNSAGTTSLLLTLIGRCADERHPFAYLSVPITTGRAHIDQEASQAAREDTIAHNKKRAHLAADRLRRALNGMVIDPSRLLDIPAWRQSDYHAFWVSVIERFAERVFFLDEWQYSVGCTIEFAKAMESGLPTLTENLAPIDAAGGQSLIRAAIDEYDVAGRDSHPLRRSLSMVEEAVAKAQRRP